MRLESLVDALEERSRITPQRAAFEWLSDDRSSRNVLTYRDLRDRAAAISVTLQAEYTAGDRALLLFPPGLEFIEAFFGCVYAGLIAVPICPPRRHRSSHSTAAIVANAKPAVVLSTADFAASRQTWFAETPSLLLPPWLAVDALRDQRGVEWRPGQVQESVIALLQYTSGTTGSPKGVMVSHGNLVHNAATIRRAFGPEPHPRRAFWLPMYHDMGLIGAM